MRKRSYAIVRYSRIFDDMSAIIHLNDRVIAWGLGINEASSAINVARYVSSVISQPEETQIIVETARTFHLRLPKLPVWLADVSF